MLKLELRIGLCLLCLALGNLAGAQAITTTTVQGTVYLANGQVGSGTLVVSWPTFTTAAGQLVAADSTTVSIAASGLVSVNLAPNQGATRGSTTRRSIISATAPPRPNTGWVRLPRRPPWRRCRRS